MNPRLRNRSLPLFLLAILLPAGARAQEISLKTAPIATGAQFLVFPTRGLGMGSLSVVGEDPWQDPFVSPARGSRTAEGAEILVLPTFYTGTDELVGGRSLPAAVIGRRGRFFGGLGGALQALDDPNRNAWVSPSPVVGKTGKRTNRYVYGSAGLTLKDGRTSLGVAAMYADLDALDGVRQLYSPNGWIQERGTLRDFRLGALRELDGGASLEATLLSGHMDMTHDLTYTDWHWDDEAHRSWTSTRLATNRDRTHTLGLSLRFTSAPDTAGTRRGVLLTINHKTHPSIPNYDLVSIPRDPGESWAYDVGYGIHASHGRTSAGLEMILEPAWSHTWAVADTLTTAGGRTFRPGDRTVDNHFRFLNLGLTGGLQHDGDSGGYQLGFGVKLYHYSLRQDNRLAGTYTEPTNDWLEWSPSASGYVKFGRAELRYTARVNGKGFPDLHRDYVLTAPGPGTDFLVAAPSPVALESFAVLTQQFTVSIPLRP